MARPRQHVTAAELAVLQVLWQRSPRTVRQLAEELYPGGRPSRHATVQKLLERLEVKRYVARQAGVRAREFKATVSREELIGRELQATADKLCEGSLTPLLTHLAETARFRARDLERLRALVDELDRKRRRKRR